MLHSIYFDMQQDYFHKKMFRPFDPILGLNVYVQGQNMGMHATLWSIPFNLPSGRGCV